jgi:hypothetical protein
MEGGMMGRGRGEDTRQGRHREETVWNGEGIEIRGE